MQDMIVSYKPASPDRGDPQVWEFDPARVYSDECELIEEHYGLPWDAFVSRARVGETKARRLLLWHLMRRSAAAAPGPNGHVNLKDVPRFMSGELVVEMTVDELVEFRARMVKSSALKESERAAALAQLDDQIAEAREREGRPADSDGHPVVDGAVVTYGAPAAEADPLPEATDGYASAIG